MAGTPRVDFRLRLGLLLLAGLAAGLAFAVLAAGLDLDPHLHERLCPPSPRHLLGTDPLGRDLLACLAAGTFLSLAVALSAVLLAALVGGALGFSAGWRGGAADRAVRAAADFALAFPGFLLALLLVALLGQRAWHVVLALAAGGWAPTARLVRGEVRRIKALDFICAARGFHASSRHIALSHMLPLLLPLLLTQAASGVAAAVLAEASLSFLGLGLDPRLATLGGLIDQARGHFIVRPLLLIAPGACLTLLAAAFLLLAEALAPVPGGRGFANMSPREYNGRGRIRSGPKREVAMEKRKEMRIKRRILSSLEDKPAIIVDLSEGGIQISMNRPPRDQAVAIKLQVGGKVITLKGDVRWIGRAASGHSASNVGIAIREAPPEYYRMLAGGD